MPQLVNQDCAVCRGRIASVLDGEFCRACGSPVHRWCKQADESASSRSRCGQCGGDTSDRDAMAARVQLLAMESAEREYREQVLTGNMNAGEPSRTDLVLQLGGVLLLLAGAGLYVGNRTGVMPTFPFAGAIVGAIGGAMFSAAWIRPATTNDDPDSKPWT